MKKPVFHHSNTVYTLAWIFALPILIDICTGCTLISFWIVWMCFAVVLVLSIIRIIHGFRQKCYKFSWGLIAQLVLGAAILLFFQLSFNNVIHTAVSNPIAPPDVRVANPILPDSAHMEGAYCPIDKDTVIYPAFDDALEAPQKDVSK